MIDTLIITRPKAQSSKLEKHFQSRFKKVICSACLHIEKNPNFDPIQMQEHAIKDDIIIVTSVNATRYCEIPSSSPPILAIGPATQQQLIKQGHAAVHLPSHYNSEGVIGYLKKHPQTKKISILTREGSQSPIIQYLKNKHYSLQIWETYQSTEAAIDFSLIDRKSSLLIFTSLKGLKSWTHQIPDSYQNWFKEQQLLVISEKMLAFCQTWGMIKTPWQAKDATDESIIACIEANQ